MEQSPSIKYRLIGLGLIIVGVVIFLSIAGESLLVGLSKNVPNSGSYMLYLFLNYYREAKNYILYNVGLARAALYLALCIILVVLILRFIIKYYYYKILPIFLGTTFKSESDEFRYQAFDLISFIRKKIKDERLGNSAIKRLNKNSLYKRTFIGLTDDKKIISLSEVQRSKHLEVIGKSGTGKTKSVLAPIAAQDMLSGKSVIIVNGKGDQNFPSLAYAAAKEYGREKDFLYFNLAFPKRSHAYNPIHIGRYGDPLVIADRMFSVLGYENEYYRDVAFNFFKNIVCIMAETGKAFNLRDIYICLCSKEALDYVCNISSAKRNIKLLEWAIDSIERQKEDTLSGLKIKLEFFCLDILNAYNPDIIIEEVVEDDKIAFISLNVNMMPTLAPAVARLFLKELQQHIGAREADQKRNQNPCSIILDEFSTFIYKHFHVAISQFREGNAQLTFAHQSGRDLNLFEKELGAVVWDNAQTKIVLAQDDSTQCQMISEMIGTQKVIERTERYDRGHFFIRKPTFESSNKYVDEFLFHPNKIKKLHPYGQGYILTTKDPDAVNHSKKDSIHPECNAKKSLRINGVNFGIFPESYYLTPSVKRKHEIGGLNLTEMFLDDKETTLEAREGSDSNFKAIEWK